MVHRPPDSRLLEHLLAHEKEYARHLAALFPLEHAALAALSAYAAAAPDPAQHAVPAVVDALARADDALRRYARAVDTWRDQLAALKSLEDDLHAILRDRDMLVTRLIKASKPARDHRASRLVAPLTALGSSSLSSLPSTASASASPASTNAKLAHAQAELQACEAHLVAKERELDARRISIARDGLGARCRALIDCAWVWGEVGKQGLHALEVLGNGAAPTYPSDSASLTPSQSVSHTLARSAETSNDSKEAAVRAEQADFTISLPPAHAISELAFPTAQPSDTPPVPTKPAPRRSRRTRRPPSQHITEASDEEQSNGPASTTRVSTPLIRSPFPTAPGSVESSSSESNHPVGPFEVVENHPLEVIRRSMLSPSASALFLPPANANATSPGHASAPDVRQSADIPSKPSPPTPSKRERRTSMAIFGSLRGLFRKSKERAPMTEWSEPPPAKTNGRTGGWVTRTDKRIRGRHRGEDPDVKGAHIGPRASRLRKGRPVGHAHDKSGSTLSVPGQDVDGWHTDDPAGGASIGAGQGRSRRSGTVKRHKMSVADLKGSDQGHTDGELSMDYGHRSATGDAGQRMPEPESAEIERGRRVSTRSIVSPPEPDVAHPNGSPGAPPRRARTTVEGRRPSDVSRHRRSASLSAVEHVPMPATTPRPTSPTESGNASMSWRKPPPPVASAAPLPPRTLPPPPRTRTPSPSPVPRTQNETPHVKRAVGNGHAQPSLMSLVADVTRETSAGVRKAGVGMEERGHVRSASSPVGTGEGGQSRGPVKMPLRSALRNASRTPSPSPVSMTVREGVMSARDSASLSSYETGRESLDGEAVVPAVPGPRTHSPSSSPPFTFPPPPSVDPPPVRRASVDARADSVSASASTSVTASEGPVRRKSVRVSLQPTFSPTPPALCDEEGEGYAPWSGAFSEGEDGGGGRGSKGKKGRGRGRGRGQRVSGHQDRDRDQVDVWADSSEEDEAYARAKKLLSRVGSGSKGRPM